MTLVLAGGIVVVVLCLISMQMVFVWRYYRLLSRGSMGVGELSDEVGQAPLAVGAWAPEVAIVLCLRGADPSLMECLSGVALQEYRNFQLHLVVDNINDPALDVVDDFFQTLTPPPVHVISNLTGNCSLKCAAILAAITAIPNSVEIFAFLDADTVPDQNWLRDLIAPLADPQIGATTGNRWFSPWRPTFGSYVRQIWNAAAIVQMAEYKIGWGGSFAIKRSALVTTDLPKRWGQAFCEDTMLSSVLEKSNLQLFRVSNLICENTETTTMTGACSWIVRQLVTVRLYHSRWSIVNLHGWATLSGSLIGPLAAVALYFLPDRTAFYAVCAAIVFYQVSNLVLLILIQRINLKVIDRRDGTNQQDRMPTNVFMQLTAVLLVQYIHFWSCCTAQNLRRLRWRGIEYEISQKNRIRMREYVPYCDFESTTNSAPESSQSVG